MMKLTPSKALKEIGLLKENGCYIKSTVEYKIVETALKEHELLKNTKIIVADKKITDDDLEKLKCEGMIIDNSQCEIKPLFDEETLNKLKVLEIIKDIFDFEFITITQGKRTTLNMRVTNKITYYVQNIDIKTKERFDLLKEELK